MRSSCLWRDGSRRSWAASAFICPVWRSSRSVLSFAALHPASECLSCSGSCRGWEAEGWFSSRLITGLLVVALVSIAWFVVNELRHSNPIVDLRLLRQRNFATAAFLMFVLGSVIFGTTVLVPQFLQVEMGYTAESAGK